MRARVVPRTGYEADAAGPSGLSALAPGETAGRQPRCIGPHLVRRRYLRPALQLGAQPPPALPLLPDRRGVWGRLTRHALLRGNRNRSGHGGRRYRKRRAGRRSTFSIKMALPTTGRPRTRGAAFTRAGVLPRRKHPHRGLGPCRTGASLARVVPPTFASRRRSWEKESQRAVDELPKPRPNAASTIALDPF